MTLERCPFCGSCDLENLDDAAQGGQVHCIRCEARGPHIDRLEKALGCELTSKYEDSGFVAWNYRTPLVR